MDYSNPLRYIIAGNLRRDYRVLPGARLALDIPGGSALSAAAGLRVWEKGVGLLARVGSDYPRDWLRRMASRGLDVRGVQVVSAPQEDRGFSAYDAQAEIRTENPVGLFAELGVPFPKELLGYSAPIPGLDSRTALSPLAVRAAEIPADYLDAAAAHICPMDFLAQQLLPPVFRQGHITTITLDPSPGYMSSVFWGEIPAILNGLSAFITSEEKLRSLFAGKTTELWEMAETLSHFGTELIVIRRGAAGQLLYDGARRIRWAIPAYPTRVVDPTGARDAFAGGFLAGWRNSYDPLRAVMQGNISASLVIESSDAFYAMDCMPGLAEARLAVLESQVRRL
jgi:sugar/nucleoside kinase (ribokinase family)